MPVRDPRMAGGMMGAPPMPGPGPAAAGPAPMMPGPEMGMAEETPLSDMSREELELMALQLMERVAELEAQVFEEEVPEERIAPEGGAAPPPVF